MPFELPLDREYDTIALTLCRTVSQPQRGVAHTRPWCETKPFAIFNRGTSRPLEEESGLCSTTRLFRRNQLFRQCFIYFSKTGGCFGCNQLFSGSALFFDKK